MFNGLTVITGAIVSSVIMTGVLGNDVIVPIDAVAVIWCAPSDSVIPKDQSPLESAVVVPTDVPSTNTSIIDPDSALPVTVCDGEFVVEPSIGDSMMGESGATVSTTWYVLVFVSAILPPISVES